MFHCERGINYHIFKGLHGVRNFLFLNQRYWVVEKLVFSTREAIYFWGAKCKRISRGQLLFDGVFGVLGCV